ncbi:MAG: peptide chain release factor N(5)-glutamine methyltransferase [Pseudonocardiales bacterium]|nr:MAG: peptide chain release factor N(5)-glutamine methyltransferase [Pseudonocardiales bacterium]
MTTASALLTTATALLRAAGVESARVDAELLLAHSLGVERSRLPVVEAVPPGAESAFAAALARRVLREPLQHIVGHAPFRHLELAVGPGVFVPRPETELLVDAVLPTLRSVAEPTVVDLCAGSGALALAVADEVRGARGYAVESAAAALDWLRRNTVGTSVQVVAADVRDPDLLVELRARVDAVLCNPPYVPATQRVGPEVRADPDDSVFGGPDGLDLMPAVAARAAQLLRPGGVVAIEHDDTHGESMPRLLTHLGCWRDVRAHRDLAGVPRYVTALRR